MRLIGHRGARNEAPENTIGGFKHIIALGLKAVEFDVRLLQDQQLVVIHDDDFLRTTGLDQTIAMTSSFQLAHTDNRVGWDSWPQAEPTPLLSEVLELIKHFEHIEVEIKAVNDERQAQLIAHQLHQALDGWQGRVTFTSFDLKVLEAFKSLNSSFQRGLLVEIPLGDAIIPIAKQLGCCRIGLRDSFATQDLIEKIHFEQLRCSVWTVNNVARARQLASWKIDGLITDVPSQMLAAHIEGCTL